MKSIYVYLYRGVNRLRLLYIQNILSHFYRLRLIGMGIHFEDGLKITGKCSVWADRSSHVTIGRNFRIVSSNLINPLCRHEACINVSKGALLQIGDNVGMSSPTIWVRKSLIIGNNVNLGGCHGHRCTFVKLFTSSEWCN